MVSLLDRSIVPSGSSHSFQITPGGNFQIDVSTAFGPSCLHHVGYRPDIIFHTRNLTFFYVHQAFLAERSYNLFGYNVLPPTATFFSQVRIASPVSDSSFSELSHPSLPSPSPPQLLTSPYSASPPIPTSPSSAYQQAIDGPYCVSPTFSDRNISNDFSVTPAPLPNVMIEESATIFNIILLIIYGKSCREYNPDLDTIAGALDGLKKYGVTLPSEHSDVWALLLHHARTRPIQAYALAAHHNMESLCILASQHTLNVTLDTVSDRDARTMGALYLRRLFFLHIGRREALAKIMAAPPRQHLPVRTCSQYVQDLLVTAWTRVVGDLVTRPLAHNLFLNDLASALGVVGRGLNCELCKASVEMRVAEVVGGWITVKSSI